MARALLAAAGLVLIGAPVSCGLILGLGDYKDECVEVEEGKPCPDVDAGLCPPGEKTSCYTGGADTADKGICHGGTKTCGSNGLYGPCEGEQTPKAEDCSNNLDDDCNGKVNDNCPCVIGKKYPCHTGDSSTENVGNCHDGTAVCGKDGMSLGTCMGETPPADENYTKRGDENCDGIPSADTVWVHVLGATGDQPGSSIDGMTTDADGATYIVGSFSGTLTLGTSTLSDGTFFAKLDRSGKFVWAKSMPAGAAQAYPNALEFDPKHKQVLMLGDAQAAVDFGAPTSSVATGLFLAAFDLDGTPVWAFGCAGAQVRAGAIAVDSNGQATLSGTVKGSATCGSKSVTSVSPSAESLLLVQFDSTGTATSAQVWGDTSTSPQSQSAPLVTAAPDGKLWVAWTANGTVRIGVGAQATVLSGSDGKLVVVGLDASGNNPSPKIFGDGQQDAASLTTDADGDLIMTGGNSGTVNFGGGALTSAHGDSVYLAALDRHYALLWNAQYGSDNSYADDSGIAVAREADGEFFLTSNVSGFIDFGAGQFVTDSAQYFALTRFTPKPSPTPPALVWADFYGGPKTDNHAYLSLASMHLSPRAKGTQQDLVLAGAFVKDTDFGTGPQMDTSAFNEGTAYVLRVAP